MNVFAKVTGPSLAVEDKVDGSRRGLNVRLRQGNGPVDDRRGYLARCCPYIDGIGRGLVERLCHSNGPFGDLVG